MDEADRISVAFNNSGVTRTIDRTEHTTGVLHKIKFYYVNGGMFLLIKSFLSSRKL